MSEHETEIQNHLNVAGYAEGAASTERITTLLSKLESRMAQQAFALAEADDDSYEDLYQPAA